MTKQTPKLFSTIVPGGMDMEEWAAGGFSTYIHGDGSCTEEVIKAVVLFKQALLTQLNVIIHSNHELEEIESFINNYKP